jgi:hypothetical protein
MVTLIKSQASKARYPRHDDSAEYIIEAMDFIRHGGKMTFAERRAIAQLKANNWQIQKGQVYVRQWNVMDGEHYTVRTLPLILRICIKYNLYG